MWNKPTEKRLAKIPAIGTNSENELKETKLYLHFFMGGHDWYAAEYDGKDQFFGFVILNNDYQNAEWSYFSLSELVRLRQGFVEVDCERATYFPVKKAKDIVSLTSRHPFSWLN